MGAGSAKGLQPEDDDDADKFSTTSSDKWENDGHSSDEDSSYHVSTNNNKNIKKTIAEVTPTFDSGPSSSNNETGDQRNGGIQENGKSPEKSGGNEAKKRFGIFKSKRDDQDKDDEGEEDEEDKKKKKDSKKDSEKRGFKLFGWRNKKTEENDGELDKDIDDLEKTFDSLGIVGKNMWGEDGPPPPKPRKETADDLELLEPMRKRKNVRVRGTRGMNGIVSGGNEVTGLRVGTSAGGGSSGSRRTFKYSWETENETMKTTKQEDDEWEYKAVVIEGFDIDKFRKANKRDSMFDSTSLPNAVSGEGEEDVGIRSPLRYDQNEQQILASIERDFTFN